MKKGRFDACSARGELVQAAAPSLHTLQGNHDERDTPIGHRRAFAALTMRVEIRG
jgi:hypothetical protein